MLNSRLEAAEGVFKALSLKHEKVFEKTHAGVIYNGILTDDYNVEVRTENDWLLNLYLQR